MMSEPKTSSSGIHPSAVVEDGASIAPDVTIGPFSVVGKNVSIAAARFYIPCCRRWTHFNW